MTRASYLTFAVLLAVLGLAGCGGGAEENVPGSTASSAAGPSMPTGVTVTPVSASQINLSWNAATTGIVLVSAASSGEIAGYNVYRDGTQIAALGAVTSFQDSGLAPSTDYSYQLEAVDTGGKKSNRTPPAWGKTKSAPDNSAPSTPASLTATTVSSSQINLGWAAATDNVGVTGYNVFRGGTLVATLGAVTSYQNTGLAAFTTYTYTVQAFDVAGNLSGVSTSAVATTQPVPDTTPPSTPTGLSASAVSSSQINLAWNASSDNVGVTAYNVYRGGFQIASLGAVTIFQDSGLVASTIYSYTVRALDAAGNFSGPSISASATTHPPAGDTTPPSVPAGLTATPASSTQINLSWTAASDNIGVTGYNVYRFGTLIATLGAVTSYQNTGLAPSTSYTYSVRAFDAAGNISVASSSVNATTQAVPDTTAPSTPTGLSATAVSTSQINLSWNAATDNVGVTGYNVYRGGSLIATLGTVTTFQNTGLSSSTTYSYTVRALDAAANISAPSSSASATTQTPPDTTAPSIPVGLTATAVSSTQINLSWTASTDNVGVTGYNVYRGGLQIATLGVVTTFQNLGLTGSTTYSYTVRARDAAGNISGQSTAANATTLAPGTTATLAWDAVTATNLSGYRIYYGTAPGTYLQPVGQGLNVGNVTTFIVTGLSSGTRYYFAVTAFDTSNNESAYSNEVFKDMP